MLRNYLKFTGFLDKLEQFCAFLLFMYVGFVLVPMRCFLEWIPITVFIRSFEAKNGKSLLIKGLTASTVYLKS